MLASIWTCKPKRKISSAIITGFIWGPLLSLGCTRWYANEQGGWRFSIPNHEQKELPEWTSGVGGLTIELPDHFILFPHVSTIGSYKWWGPRPSLTSTYRSEFQPLKCTFLQACDWLLLQIVDLFYYSIHLDLQMKGVVRYFMVYNHWKIFQFINTHIFIHIYIYIRICDSSSCRTNPIHSSFPTCPHFSGGEFELPPNGCWFRNTFQKLEDLSALEFMLVFLAPIIFAEGDWDLLKVIFFGTLSETSIFAPPKTGGWFRWVPLTGRAWTHQV